MYSVFGNSLQSCGSEPLRWFIGYEGTTISVRHIYTFHLLKIKRRNDSFRLPSQKSEGQHIFCGLSTRTAILGTRVLLDSYDRTRTSDATENYMYVILTPSVCQSGYVVSSNQNEAEFPCKVSHDSLRESLARRVSPQEHRNLLKLSRRGLQFYLLNFF